MPIRDITTHRRLLFSVWQSLTIVDTPLHALRVRVALVRRRDRRVARILRHAADAHRTTPLAPIKVPESDLIRTASYPLPERVARHPAKVLPILVFVPSMARRNASLVIPRLVCVTPIPLCTVFVPNTGRNNEVVVPRTTLVGLTIAFLRPPAYLVILSNDTDGHRLVCVVPIVQHVVVRPPLVVCILGSWSRTEIGKFARSPLGNDVLARIFSPTR